MPAKASLEQIAAWTVQDRDFWNLRNTRFHDDQDLFRLVKPSASRQWSREDSDIVVLNDPKVLIKKVARLIGRHDRIIEVTPSGPDLSDTAQRIENYLYDWWRAIEARWASGLNNPYRFDEGFYISLRGWLVSRTMLKDPGIGGPPDPSDPAGLYDHRLFDAAEVYPATSGDRITRVSHIYKATVRELRGDPFFNELKGTSLQDADDKQIVEIKAIYWEDTGSWWHAVLLGSDDWVKPPAEIGYNPWTITLANGAAYRTTPWDDSNIFVDQVGTGLLDETRDTHTQLNRMATKLNVLLSGEANPAITVYTANGNLKKLDLSPGARNVLAQKDKMEAHRVGPAVGDYRLLWDIFTQRLERGSLPGAFFGEGQSATGFSEFILMAAGKDMLSPYTVAINNHDELVSRKVLELYRDFGPGKPLQARMRPGMLGTADFAEISANDIILQGVFSEITRPDMTPQELAQTVNLALAMVREGAISMDTARGPQWIGLKNPASETLKVLQEKVYLNDSMVQALVPIAAGETGHPELVQLWQQVNGIGQPQGPGGPPPGGPPSPGMPGLPSQVLPPGMQNGNPATSVPNTGDPAMMNQLMSMITGGAAGGMGMGGTPPVPGTTAPIPQLAPPGRGF